MYGLTQRQHDLLTFIRTYIAERGSSPSFAEMADGIGLSSKSGIDRLLNALEDRGLIVRMANRHRSVALSEGAHV